MKKYIWGFPGLGKSYINNESIVDADCEQFKYIFSNGVPDNLHKSGELDGVLRNPEYPENYFKYIESLDADIVLLNCHINLLERLDKERVLLVYPSEALIPEYLERYQDRGDNPFFIYYMTEEASGMIQHIDRLDYKKYKVFKENTYLSDLFERNDFKVKVMTRAELTEQLQRAMDLGVLKAADDIKAIIFNDAFATVSHSDDPIYKLGPETLAHLVLEGEYTLNIERLLMVCMQREAQIEKEKVFADRRGGLTREELEDKIMQGIVNGALSVYHGQIAPYSYGYAVSIGDNTWHCYCDFFEIPGKIASSIENGDRGNAFDVNQMLAVVAGMDEKQITKFVPEKETDFVRWGSRGYGSRGSIATVRDVHAGKGFDGIVQHHYHGDYSSITTVSQNNLVETLVYMKGFCLDCLSGLDIGPDGRQKVVEYLKKHGTDVSTQEKLSEWIKANPEKCGKEENRKLSLDEQIRVSAVQKSVLKTEQSDISRDDVR